MAKQTFTASQVLTAAQMNSLQANDYNWTVDTKTDNYTLVAGDAGKRIVMNAATAKTITVNTSVFTAGDVVWIHNINTGTCTVTAGTATVNSAGSLALGQWGGGALYFTSASTAIFFPAGAEYGLASGGSSSSITVGGVNYTLLTFTTDGTLTVSAAGKFDVLLVGGGGGGGGLASNAFGGACAGGGGGQVIQTSIYLAAGSYSVDVGAGGAGGNRNGGGASRSGAAGRLSSIGTAIVAGGGDGAGGNSTGLYLYAGTGGSSGGSARGAGQDKPTPLIGANLGGTSPGDNAAGGGGGAGGVGGNASGTTGGAGGNGSDVSTFIGGSTYYAGAGGGGGATGTGGAAGSGGVAGKTSGSGNNGVNYGAAGGGSFSSTDLDPYGGNGAAGVVYVRFK